MWLALIVSETIGASSGVGHRAMEAREFMTTDMLEGRVKLDLGVPHPHPRRHGDVELAEIEGRLLAAILGE